MLDALSTLLETDDVAFGALETEQFARGRPWLSADHWVPQLSAVIALQRDAGRDTFLVVATTETESELRAVIDAVAAERVVVVCLSAPPEVVTQRVSEREPDSWPGKAVLIEHARELAGVIPGLPSVEVVLQTADRRAVGVAAEVRDLLVARGVLGGRSPRRPSV